jgi:hypothetical protein
MTIVTIATCAFALAAIAACAARAEDDLRPAPALAAASRGVPLPRHPAELIDIRTLGAESDYGVFMQRDCPEHVRIRALRHLWRQLPQPGPLYDLG